MSMPQREITLKSDRISIPAKSFTNKFNNKTFQNQRKLSFPPKSPKSCISVTARPYLHCCMPMSECLRVHVCVSMCSWLHLCVMSLFACPCLRACRSVFTCPSLPVHHVLYDFASACHSHPQVLRHVCMVMSSSAVSMSRPSIWMTYSHGSFALQSKHHQKG